MAPNTMNAVILKGKLKVEVEQRPVPQIQEPTDVIVKVRYTALCGRYIQFFAELRNHWKADLS